MAFLAVDVGNTRLKWALYEQPRPGASVLAQGAEFLENIDKLAEGAWSSLQAPERMLGCAVAARDGESPALALEGPMDSHRDLQLCIKDAVADCTQMQAHEKGLADSLEALAAPLQAAA